MIVGKRLIEALKHQGGEIEQSGNELLEMVDDHFKVQVGNLITDGVQLKTDCILLLDHLNVHSDS